MMSVPLVGLKRVFIDGTLAMPVVIEAADAPRNCEVASAPWQPLQNWV